jgi:hypothetical protein
MPTSRTDNAPDAPRLQSRLRFEAIFISAWLAVGLFVVPALVYWVGTATLGAYGERAGLGDFYSAYFTDLASLTGRTWLLALGPLLLMSLVRAIYIGVPRRRDGSMNESDDEDGADLPPRSPPAPQSRRVEPRIGH